MAVRPAPTSEEVEERCLRLSSTHVQQGVEAAAGGTHALLLSSMNMVAYTPRVRGSAVRAGACATRQAPRLCSCCRQTPRRPYCLP